LPRPPNDRENREALVEIAGRDGVSRSAARARGGTGGSRSRRYACRDSHGAHSRIELEAAAGELVECALVLKEDDLAASLVIRAITTRSVRITQARTRSWTMLD
jgi:hypothetical protein